ncbi:MAG TPA: kelch repeat-containing protein, partial [Dehalococcoidia bacterium]|nr:kelch repeat-containing protein [Dehalococcoidia bacterium]
NSSMTLRLTLLVAASLLALALGGFACGGDDDEEQSEQISSTVEEGGVAETATEGAEAGPEAAAEGDWSELSPLPDGPRQELGVAALGGEVYTVGGFDSSGSITPIVEVYNPDTEEWREVASVPAEMHHANVAVVGERLYVVGFETGPFVGDGRVFEYDPAADSWTQKTSMPAGTERGASGVAVIDDLIYVAGGFRDGAAVSDFSRYDPAADAWEELPDLPSNLDHLTAGAIDGIFYTAGGRAGSIQSHTGETWAFDPATNEWMRKADLPTSRAGIAGAVLDGKFYVFGGEGNFSDPTGVFNQIEAYDPEADTWELVGTMESPRHGTGAAVIGSFICIPGGADVQAFGAVATADVFQPPD